MEHMGNATLQLLATAMSTIAHCWYSWISWNILEHESQLLNATLAACLVNGTVAKTLRYGLKKRTRGPHKDRRHFTSMTLQECRYPGIFSFLQLPGYLTPSYTHFYGFNPYQFLRFPDRFSPLADWLNQIHLAESLSWLRPQAHGHCRPTEMLRCSWGRSCELRGWTNHMYHVPSQFHPTEEILRLKAQQNLGM